MDSEFDKRWKAGETPFDGRTVSLEDFVPVTVLRPMLDRVAKILHAHNPEARLFRMLDWHEHDGYIKEAVPTTWEELHSLVASDNALLGAKEWDRFVRTAFFPEGHDFLLRFYIPGIHDNPFHDHDDPHLVDYGIFDLTSQAPLVIQIEQTISEAGAIDVQTLHAKEFFDKNYGG